MTYEHSWHNGATELRQKDVNWLRAACRERGITSWQLQRPKLIAALLKWEYDNREKP